MNPDTLAYAALAFAAPPAVLFVVNLFFYCRLPQRPSPPMEPLSVLIPARNEERNITATLKAVLANQACDFEVLVLDDHSSDRTAKIVREFAALDPRLRLESGPPLPSGWCGKQHACHRLAQLARHRLFVFIDADVRLAPDALSRLSFLMADPGLALASGIPKQEFGTFSERLLLPLIHFILLSFLPMPVMKWTKRVAFSAGCGQLFVARHSAYKRCGGHAQLQASLHDGIQLPRVFRRAGFKTALFDATDLATCRMYSSNAETWRGLGKNAIEGLAAPCTIVPMTIILLGGQVLPFVLLVFLRLLSPAGLACVALAITLSMTARIISARRFQQPAGSAVLHPAGVLALLAIQWHAWFRHLFGRPATWKGRLYPATKGPASKSA